MTTQLKRTSGTASENGKSGRIGVFEMRRSILREISVDASFMVNF